MHIGVHLLTGRWYPFLVTAGADDPLVPAARTVAASIEWLPVFGGCRFWCAMGRACTRRRG